MQGTDPRRGCSIRSWRHKINGGTNGFKLIGEVRGDYTGHEVSGVGDVNGDGIDDVIVGSEYAGFNGTYSGAAYVIFGSDQGFPPLFDLTSLDSTTGVKILGDVNGDGINDIFVGASGADGPPGFENAGASYIIFGTDQGFATPSIGTNLTRPFSAKRVAASPNG